MEELDILKKESNKNKTDLVQINSLLDLMKKNIKTYDEFKNIINVYKINNFIPEYINNINKLEKMFDELKNNEKNVLTKMKLLERKIIDKNDKHNKDESGFIFYNFITNYSYLEFDPALDWDIIKKIFNENKEGYVDVILNINKFIRNNLCDDQLEDDIKEYFGDKNEQEIDLLNDIIYLIKNINNNRFFNKLITKKGKIFFKDEDFYPYVKNIPKYFYKNIIYNGNISLNIDNKIYKIDNPTLDDIKLLIPYKDYFLKIHVHE